METNFKRSILFYQNLTKIFSHWYVVFLIMNNLICCWNELFSNTIIKFNSSARSWTMSLNLMPDFWATKSSDIISLFTGQLFLNYPSVHWANKLSSHFFFVILFCFILFPLPTWKKFFILLTWNIIKTKINEN